MPFKDADKRRKYKQEYRKRQREAKRQEVSGNPLPPGGEPNGLPPVAVVNMPFRTPHDALAILGEQINRVRADPNAGIQTVGRSVGFLVSVGLRALELTDLAERVAALEAQS